MAVAVVRAPTADRRSSEPEEQAAAGSLSVEPFAVGFSEMGAMSVPSPKWDSLAEWLDCISTPDMLSRTRC